MVDQQLIHPEITDEPPNPEPMRRCEYLSGAAATTTQVAREGAGILLTEKPAPQAQTPARSRETRCTAR